MTQPDNASSKIGPVMFHRRAMITSQDGMLSHVDVKSLQEILADAVSAVLTTAGITGTWTTSLEVEVRSGAGVCTIFDGSAPNATVRDILIPNSAESHD